MLSPTFAAQLERIIQADITPSAFRSAVFLLNHCPDTGHLILTWAQLQALVGCTNRDAARRHLTALQKAGLIHYSTNEEVYIAFLAYRHAPDLRVGAPDLRVDAPDLRVDAPDLRANGKVHAPDLPVNGKVRAPDLRVDAPKQRADAPDLRVDAPKQRAVGGKGGKEGWMERWINSFNDLMTDPSLLPSSYTRPGPAETEINEWMLRDDDVAIPVDLARHIAPLLRKDMIFGHAVAFLAERNAGRDQDTGALLHRLSTPRTYPHRDPHSNRNNHGLPFYDRFAGFASPDVSEEDLARWKAEQENTS